MRVSISPPVVSFLQRQPLGASKPTPRFGTELQPKPANKTFPWGFLALGLFCFSMGTVVDLITAQPTFIPPASFRVLPSKDPLQQRVQDATGKIIVDTVPDQNGTLPSYEAFLTKIELGKVAKMAYVRALDENIPALFKGLGAGPTINGYAHEGFFLTLHNGAQLHLPSNKQHPEQDKAFSKQLWDIAVQKKLRHEILSDGSRDQ